MNKKYFTKTYWPTPEGPPVEVSALLEISVDIKQINAHGTDVDGGRFFMALQLKDQQTLVDALVAATHEATRYQEMDWNLDGFGELTVKAVVTPQEGKIVVCAAYTDKGELVDVTKHRDAIEKALQESK